jgi:hypothetical protein
MLRQNLSIADWFTIGTGGTLNIKKRLERGQIIIRLVWCQGFIDCMLATRLEGLDQVGQYSVTFRPDTYTDFIHPGSSFDDDSRIIEVSKMLEVWKEHHEVGWADDAQLVAICRLSGRANTPKYQLRGTDPELLQVLSMVMVEIHHHIRGYVCVDPTGDPKRIFYQTLLHRLDGYIKEQNSLARTHSF